MNPQALAKSSLLRILLPLGLVLGVVFFTVRQAHALLDRALHAAFGEHQHAFESVWFDWSGDVVAKQVVLRPNDIGKPAEVRFERVWLETPGWTFFLRNVFDRSLQRARLPRVHLVFGDATAVEGLEVLVPELGPVGVVSGAVFESDGCGRGTSFTRDRLTAMGMSPGPTSLEIDHRVTGDAMQILVALNTPGSSRTQLDRTGRLDAPRDSLLGERAAPRIEYERWSVRDQGFVAARNRFCAAQDGVTPREALERHVAAVDRRLQQAGLAVDENAHAFYRRFARSGGEMSFGGEYKPPLSVEESLDSRDDGRALARMNAVLERDRRAVPIVWRVVPLPPAPEEPVVPVPVETPVVAAPIETPIVATPEPEPAPPPVTVKPEPPAPPVAEPVEPPPVVAVPVEPKPAEPEVAKPEPVATPPVVTPARPKSGGTRIERVAPLARRPTLSFDDLAGHRGRQVRLWTVHNPPRTVEVLEAGGDEVRVRVKLVSGQAEYTVKRAGFLRATLVR